MLIEFDATKNQANVALRNLSFELAAHFDFATALIYQDTRKKYPEARFVALGFLDQRLHVLCFTPVAGGYSCHQFSQGQQQRGKDL